MVSYRRAGLDTTGLTAFPPSQDNKGLSMLLMTVPSVTLKYKTLSYVGFHLKIHEKFTTVIVF